MAALSQKPPFTENGSDDLGQPPGHARGFRKQPLGASSIADSAAQSRKKALHSKPSGSVAYVLAMI
jgi:hypothetical protein